MPLYEFECERCQAKFEVFDKIETCPKELPCPDCGGKSVKVLARRGAVLSDTPSWLDRHVQGALLDIDSRNFRPIETKSQLNRYLKQNGLCEAKSAGTRWI